MENANYATYKRWKKLKEATKEAFNPGKSYKERFEALIGLHGVGIPIASAILSMKFPEEYAIIDTNVLKELRRNHNFSSEIEKHNKVILCKKEKFTFSAKEKLDLQDFAQFYEKYIEKLKSLKEKFV